METTSQKQHFVMTIDSRQLKVTDIQRHMIYELITFVVILAKNVSERHIVQCTYVCICIYVEFPNACNRLIKYIVDQ
jgi:hypothetical protein